MTSLPSRLLTLSIEYLMPHDFSYGSVGCVNTGDALIATTPNPSPQSGEGN